MATPISAVITTYNNAETIERCLASVAWADEIVVLDSFSDDGTDAIAERAGAVVAREVFRGFGPQKQRAVSLASHDWILLLDADEALDDDLAAAIRAQATDGLRAPGYRLLRREWLYWRWQHRWSRCTDHLRLFDRRRIDWSQSPVHAAPRSAVRTPALRGRLLHWGDSPMAHRIAKLNRYTSLSMEATAPSPVRCLLGVGLAPAAAFVHDYLLRLGFLSGAAGFCAAGYSAFNAFAKYAKLIEAYRSRSVNR